MATKSQKSHTRTEVVTRQSSLLAREQLRNRCAVAQYIASKGARVMVDVSRCANGGCRLAAGCYNTRRRRLSAKTERRIRPLSGADQGLSTRKDCYQAADVSPYARPRRNATSGFSESSYDKHSKLRGPQEKCYQLCASSWQFDLGRATDPDNACSVTSVSQTLVSLSKCVKLMAGVVRHSDRAASARWECCFPSCADSPNSPDDCGWGPFAGGHSRGAEACL